MKLDTAILILLALGLITGSAVSELQHRRIKALQIQVDELRIIVNQKFLPAMILDKKDFNVR
jgi:hypothetical protein